MAIRPRPARLTPVTQKDLDALRSTVDQCCADLAIQFKRIAQIQAELDDVRRAWVPDKTRRRRPRR
jgi:hypothetical protein